MGQKSSAVSRRLSLLTMHLGTRADEIGGSLPCHHARRIGIAADEVGHDGAPEWTRVQIMALIEPLPSTALWLEPPPAAT